jgi:hypothetical protein
MAKRIKNASHLSNRIKFCKWIAAYLEKHGQKTQAEIYLIAPKEFGDSPRTYRNRLAAAVRSGYIAVDGDGTGKRVYRAITIQTQGEKEQ